MSEKRIVPDRPTEEHLLQAVTLQIELNPVEKEDLPVSVVQALPLGSVKVRDGRNGFNVDALSVVNILSHFGSSSVELAVDYNHGMYYGEDMTAAGWGESMYAIVPPDIYKRVEPFVEGLDRVTLLESEEEETFGIYISVRWTNAAAEKIREREYKYISPVILFNHQGDAAYIWNLALVNNPAIEGMDALAAAQALPPKRDKQSSASSDVEQDSADSGAACEQISQNDDTNTEGESPMNEHIMALAAALGFEPPVEDSFDAGEFATNVLAKITEEREKHEADLASAHTQLDGVAAQLESVNSDNEAMKAQLDEITAEAEKAAEENRKSEIDDAISSGVLAEAQREWATENYDAFVALKPTLKETPQGPPQGEETKVTEEVADFSMLEGNDRVEFIRKYATENEITFEDAFVKLSE